MDIAYPSPHNNIIELKINKDWFPDFTYPARIISEPVEIEENNKIYYSYQIEFIDDN